MVNAVLYSGGKDSTLALHKMAEKGVEIDLLITMLSENAHSYMFHYPNLSYTKLQAEALGIKQVFASTKGEKEKELDDLRESLVENKVDMLVTGATYSEYQANRINGICKKLGIEHAAPLWHIDLLEELNEIARNFEAIITSVSAEGLDRTFLGKKIDNDIIIRLQDANRRYGIHMLFEGGEAESFVLNAPLFKKSIQIVKARTEWNGVSGAYFIEDAKLIGK